MNQKIIQQIGRSQRISIINLLKRSEGLAVAEMSDQIGMSYMGVKQHCLSLHAEGYLTTKRSPRSAGRIGRPEMLYLLTPKANALFPEGTNPIALELLEAAKSLYGATAPEKLLFKYFQSEIVRYEAKVKGDTTLERAKSLSKIRDGEGCLSDVRNESGKVKIVEHTSPYSDLLERYPSIAKMEEDMFSKVLITGVKRTVSQDAGQYLGEFAVG